jgi:hypothetical protein
MADCLIHVSDKYKFPIRRHNKYTDFILNILKSDGYHYLFEEGVNSTVDPNSIPCMVLPDNMSTIKEFKDSTKPTKICSSHLDVAEYSIYEYTISDNGDVYYLFMHEFSDESMIATEDENGEANILKVAPMGSCNRLMLSIIRNNGIYADTVRVKNEDYYKPRMEHYIREIKYYKSSKLFNPDTIVALEDL